MATSNMVVQNNILALNTHRNMKSVGNMQSKASEKLSSGYAINRAADNATGLAISEKMRAQIRGLNQASSNVSDAISLIATAEGGMQGIDDMLHRIRELVDYAANDTQENNAIGTGDRQKIQDEIDALVAEIDSMGDRVEYNKKKLIDGTYQDTKAQLATAKATYDRTSLEVVEAEAKRIGIEAQLGDEALVKQVQQAKVGATATFAADYAAYSSAKDDMLTALGVNSVADAQAKMRTLDGDDIATSGAVLNTAQATDFRTALAAYNTAAKTLGLDELDLAANLTTGTAPAAAATAAGSALGVVGTDVETTKVAAYATPIAGSSYETYKNAMAAADQQLSGTAYGNLETMQTVIDAPDGVPGSLATYKTAVQDYATQTATYESMVTQYNNAKDALQAQIDASGKTLASLNVNDVTDTSTTAITNLGDFQSALLAYNNAAVALGIDELNLGQMSTAVAGVLEGQIATAGGVINGSTPGQLIVTGDTYGNDWNTAQTAGNRKGQIAQYALDTAAFNASEQTYKNAVSNRDIAQDQVTSLQQQLSEATKSFNAAQVRFSAASTSYTAAQELDNAKQSKALHFQVGANANQSLTMSIGSIKSNTLGIGDGKGNSGSVINVVKDTGADITASLDVLDQALSYVTAERSKLGAAQNRMEYTQQSLDITSENISDAESRIRDTDMAKEMMNFTKANILQQVSVSMMAQANQVPQGVLQLLG